MIAQPYIPGLLTVAQKREREAERSRRRRELLKASLAKPAHVIDPRRSVYLPPRGIVASQFFGRIWQ